MVASVRTLLATIQSSTPELYRDFARTTAFMGTRAESVAIGQLYQRLEEINFSHRVLAARPDRLAVLRVAAFDGTI